MKEVATASRPGSVKTGHGQPIQLAIDEPIPHLSTDNVRIAKDFVTYTVLALGRFRGGLAGVDKHFARIEKKYSIDYPS